MSVASRRAARRALALLALLAAAGCARDPVASTGFWLPPELAARSLAPHIEGRVAARREGPELRIHVRATTREPLVREAVVTVPAAARLLWPDGSAAAPDDLRVGREVVLWTTGAELRSYPPQVTAETVALRR